MIRVELVFRLLMLLACLVPFTNTRQIEIACARILPLGTAGNGSAPAPFQRQQEDDNERAEQVDNRAKQRVCQHRLGQEADPLRQTARLHRLGTCAAQRNHIPAPLANPDPFRNGLGTPYRC